MIDDGWKIKNKTFANRVVLQPMEGCDFRGDGTPDAPTA